MFTYEDLLEVTEESGLISFVLAAISDYKAGKMYKKAADGYDYFTGQNVTIREFQKLLYTVTGEVVPDNYSANYKFSNAFFKIFIIQQVAYLLGNGVTFNNEDTKEKLGGDRFDNQLFKLAIYSLWGIAGYGMYNYDKLEIFKATEFVPLFGEEDGALHAGIRWWQIDDSKPLRATLYEEDGYTDYIWRRNSRTHEDKGEVLHPKRPYIQTVATSEADGTEILDGKNYPGFPIIPLWGNPEHISELDGIREKIDGYDLLQSGLCNTIDDASLVYWTIQNAGGMDDVDLATFLQHMRTVKAAVMEDDGAHAEPHTLDVPYQSTMTALETLKDSLYRDAMALNTDHIAAGNITATAINAAYENLDLKCDLFEMCVSDFIDNLLKLAGIEDSPTFKRTKVTNMAEETQMVLSAAQYMDPNTILKHLPFLSPDEIETIMEEMKKEEAERFEQEMSAFDDMAEQDEYSSGVIDELGTEIMSMLDGLGV